MRRHQMPRPVARQTASCVNQPTHRNPLQALTASVVLIVVCVALTTEVRGGTVVEGAAVLDWQRATAAAAWHRRVEHASVVYGGKLWVMGGRSSTGTFPFTWPVEFNDVWSSVDGVAWSVNTVAAPWEERYSLAAVPCGSLMRLTAGDSDTGEGHRDVWSSANGTTWLEGVASAQWAPRSEHTSVVHDGYVWVIGGHTNSIGPRADVWRSSGGDTWREVTPMASWAPRSRHASVAFDGKLWVMGGATETNLSSEVWSSENGSDWQMVTAVPPWIPRMSHTAVVHDDRIWIVGGRYDRTSHLNDSWFSDDGINWARAATTSVFPARTGHTSAVHHGRIWVLGGSYNAEPLDTPYLNDVWYAVPRPGNDDFSSPDILIGATGRAGHSNLNATIEIGEPLHAGVDGGASLWWRWAAPTSGSVTFDTDGSASDTLLAVYVGDAITSLTEVVSDNNSGPGVTSRVIFDAAGGTTYAIALDGVSSAQARIALNWSHGAATIWGNVRTLGLGGTAGIVVSTDDGLSSGVTSPIGYYELEVPAGWSGTVSADVPTTSSPPLPPSSSQWLIRPTGLTFTNIDQNQSSQDFTIIKDSARIARYLLGEISLTETEARDLDLNLDGKIDIADELEYMRLR